MPFRLTYRGKPVAPWRATRKESLADAVPRYGSRDEHLPDRIYLEPFVGVEERS